MVITLTDRADTVRGFSSELTQPGDLLLNAA